MSDAHTMWKFSESKISVKKANFFPVVEIVVNESFLRVMGKRIPERELLRNFTG